MKYLILLIAILAISATTVLAQAPKSFNYQGVARDAQGQVLSEKTIGLKLSIVSENSPNQAVYTEEHQVKTNKLGLFSIKIGKGEAVIGSMENVDWGSVAHYLSTEMDVDNNGHYIMMGTAPLLSVPYALYAEKAGSSSDGSREIGFGGTNGQTIRHNGGDWEASSSIYNDGTNVGIGTTTPTEKLDIDGNLNLTQGNEITFGGDRALAMDGSRNIMQGRQAGEAITTGVNNNMMGYRAGWKTTEGSNNSMIGYQAGFTNTTGSWNTFIGYKAGYSNTTGANNFYSGPSAGYGSTTGINNVAIGTGAGLNVGSANNNTFIGRNSGYQTTANENMFVGYEAGYSNTTGTRNTYLGTGADGDSTLTNATAIGYNAYASVSNSVVLGNNANVGIGTSAPEAKLDVDGDLRLSGHIIDYTNSPGNTGQVLVTTSSGLLWVDVQFPESGWEVNGDTLYSSVDSTVTIREGNTGIGTTSPQDKLHVEGNIRMEDGNQQVGYIPVSDVDGKMTWTAPTSISTATAKIISDADNDTKIQVEESGDEDVIRFDIGGNEVFTMDTLGRLQTINSYQSVFLGEEAGKAGNFNVYVGYKAGKNSETANNNVAVGRYSLRDNTSSRDNIAIGTQTLMVDTAGNKNIAIGLSALEGHYTGDGNTALGLSALKLNADGENNIAIGRQSLQGCINGSDNIAIGYRSGFNELGSNKLYIENSDADSTNALIYGEFDNDLLAVNGTLRINDDTQANGYVFTSDTNGNGSWQDVNTLIDKDTLSLITDSDNDTKIQVEEGEDDDDIIRFDVGGTQRWIMKESRIEPSNTGSSIFIGKDAGQADDLSNNQNIFIGFESGKKNTTGHSNTATGAYSFQDNTTGFYNTAIGTGASNDNTTGSNNVAIGRLALYDNQTGHYNTAVGSEALEYCADSASQNTAIGRMAGYGSNGSHNVFLGYEAGKNKDVSHRLYIDNSSTANPLIYGEFDNDWVKINGYLTPTEGIADSDNDTKIQLEESADEDIIRFDVGGVEAYTMGKSTSGQTYFNVNSSNTLIGSAMSDSITGTHNTAYGYQAGKSMTTAHKNVLVGENAGANITTGQFNVMIGPSSGQFTIDGNYNSYIGIYAGRNNLTGEDNVFIGGSAGENNTGNRNVFVGYAAGRVASGSNRLFIENTNADSSSALIFGRFDVNELAFNANVGIGTITPVARLHMYSADQDETGGIQISQGTNNSVIYHNADGSLELRKRSQTNQLLLASDGNIGIGTSDPTQKLHISSSANGMEVFVAKIENTANSNGSRDEGLLIRAGHNTYNGSEESSMIQFETPNGAYCGRIRQSGTSAVEYVSASDERLKTEIVPTEYGLDDLLLIDVKDYYFKTDRAREGKQTGFIAQQLHQHYPVAVDVGSEDLSQPWGVAYGMMTPLLVKAIQDQQEIIESVQTENETLKAELAAQKAINYANTQRLDAIEAQLGSAQTAESK